MRNKYNILIFGGVDTFTMNFIDTIVDGRHNIYWINLKRDKYLYDVEERNIPTGVQKIYMISESKENIYLQENLLKEINPDIIIDFDWMYRDERTEFFRKNVLYKMHLSKYVMVSSYKISLVEDNMNNKLIESNQYELDVIRNFNKWVIYRLPEIACKEFNSNVIFNNLQKSMLEINNFTYSENISYPFIHKSDAIDIIRGTFVKGNGLYKIPPAKYYSLHSFFNGKINIEYSIVKNPYKLKCDFDNKRFSRYIKTDPVISIRNVI